MSEFCQTCGISYKRFRGPSGLTWAAAQQVQWDRSVEEAKRGKYRGPVTRAMVLGKLHEWKQEEWDEHQRLCADYTALEALRSVDQLDLAARQEWTALDAVQYSIAQLEADLGLSSEDPF